MSDPLHPFQDIDRVLGDIETHVASRLKLARSPYIQVLKVSRNMPERRVEFSLLVDGAEFQLICEVWDDPGGYYFDTWVEVPICELGSGQAEELYRFLLVQGGDFDSRLFLEEALGGMGSQLMMGRATRCLDGLEEMISETLREARTVAKGLADQFDIPTMPGATLPQVH